jgi:hypothetical protein
MLPIYQAQPPAIHAQEQQTVPSNGFFSSIQTKIGQIFSAAISFITSPARARTLERRVQALEQDRTQLVQNIDTLSQEKTDLARATLELQEKIRGLEQKLLERETLVTQKEKTIHERDTTLQRLAGKKILHAWRRHQKKYCISDFYFEQGKSLIDSQSFLSEPKAESGVTPVYLPKELSIVLKESGKGASKKRRDQMKEVRLLCERNHTTCLVVPKARVHGNFLIEQRLPIETGGTKEMIGFYIENKDKFKKAAEELTILFCHSHFGDVTGGKDAFQAILSTSTPRYDNYALYVEKGIGKIGLVDLESFSHKVDKTKDDWCFIRCKDVVRLFPYQFDSIIDTAKKFDPNIDKFAGELNELRDNVLKGYRTIILDHIDFLKEKGISPESQRTFPKIDKDTILQLKKNILASTLMLLKSDTFMEEIREKASDPSFEEGIIKLFPKLAESIASYIIQLFEENAQREEVSPISSYGQLASDRTLVFGNEIEEFNLRRELSSSLRAIEDDDLFCQHCAIEMVHVVFEELAKQKIISSYFREMRGIYHGIFW